MLNAQWTVIPYFQENIIILHLGLWRVSRGKAFSIVGWGHN